MTSDLPLHYLPKKAVMRHRPIHWYIRLPLQQYISRIWSFLLNFTLIPNSTCDPGLWFLSRWNHWNWRTWNTLFPTSARDAGDAGDAGSRDAHRWAARRSVPREVVPPREVSPPREVIERTERTCPQTAALLGTCWI